MFSPSPAESEPKSPGSPNIFNALDRNQDGKVDLDDLFYQPSSPELSPSKKAPAPAPDYTTPAPAQDLPPPIVPASDAIVEEADDEAMDGADLVLVYDNDEIEEHPEKRATIDDALKRLDKAGLKCVQEKSPTGLRTYVLLTAKTQQRLEDEAEKRTISMKLKPQKDDPPGTPPKSTEFVRHARDKYQRKNGRLFSPLERQRLVCTICEGSQFRGCAELDLDELVEHGVLVAALALHSAEREALESAWLGVRLWPNGWPTGWPYKTAYKAAAGRWPLRRDDNRQPRRIFPDLGLAQQPLDAIRSYLGSKIAFYFAWAEMYTVWLLVAMWLGVRHALCWLSCPLAAARSILFGMRTMAEKAGCALDSPCVRSS